MDGIIFCIAFVAATASLLSSHSVSGQDSQDDDVEAGEEDICYGYHASKLYCTCQPSDVDVHGVDCYVLSEFPSSDPLWRSFASMEKLERLTFYSQGVGTLKYVPREALKSSMGVLKTLEIKHAALGTIRAYAFVNATALTSIDLSNNLIIALERRSFVNLPVLKELTLSENELSVVRRGSFVGLTKLSILLLDRNRISHIENSVFEDLPSLQELTLMKNELSRLSVGMFRGLANLKRLELGINRIGHLGAGVFSELTLVQEINLRENGLTSINPEAFIGLQHLRVLYLNRNRLMDIADQTFGPLQSLHYLDLRYNRLATLSEEAVASLRLEKSNNSLLYVSGNNFSCDCRIKWMLELFKRTSHDDLSPWKQIECQLPVSLATTERAEELRRKVSIDDRPATMSDSPAAEKTMMTDDGDRKFVSLEDAAQFLEPSGGKVCRLNSLPKSDLSYDRSLIDGSSTFSSSRSSVSRDTFLSFVLIICTATITIVITSN